MNYTSIFKKDIFHVEDYDPCPLTCLTGGLTPELVTYETNVLPYLPRTVLNRFRVERKHMIT